MQKQTYNDFYEWFFLQKCNQCSSIADTNDSYQLMLTKDFYLSKIADANNYYELILYSESNTYSVTSVAQFLTQKTYKLTLFSESVAYTLKNKGYKMVFLQ